MDSYRLPAPSEPPAARALFARLRGYFLHTWRGRVLLLALVIYLSDKAGVPWPGLPSALARVALFGYAVVYGFKFSLKVLGRLLFKIRTKLLLSYLFVAVVPVVLLTCFFLLAGLLFSGLVASFMVTSHLDRKAETMQALAAGAFAHAEAPAVTPAQLAERLAPLGELHAGAAWSQVCDARVTAQGGARSEGSPPQARPAWLKDGDFAGLVRVQGREILRVAAVRGACTLFLDLPADRALFAGLKPRAGIEVLTIGGKVRHDARGVQIDVDDRDFERLGTDPAGRLSGMPFAATVERTDWQTGKKEIDPIAFLFHPRQLARRLSPGSLNMADLLVRALTAVGLVFLVMYGVALVLGALLARSVTRSVHALAVGTQRLRRGEFEHRIRVRTRDQLGELAESFNLMAAGVQQALVDQAEKQRLEEELRIARQIQMSLLPHAAVSVPGLRIAALCLPAAEVGGDYYDLLPLDDARLGVLVADVSGKGTSAALYMAELKGLVLSLSRITQSPARLLVEANRILAVHTDSRTFVTMTYAVLDVAAGLMRYARAGHNPLLHFEAESGRTRVLAPEGMGLGLDRGERFEQVLEEAELPLRAGDVFLFFTDGLSEAMNERSELFGELRLREILERSEQLSTEELKDRILAEIRTFVGDAAQHDDMTLVILKVV
jgi:serine phosphatase RsbU (regulator of sigma subunit)